MRKQGLSQLIAIALGAMVTNSAVAADEGSGGEQGSSTHADSSGNGASAQVDSITRVVVTASKRPQFADKVPTSLSAISQDMLDKQGVVDLVDLSRVTPGLSVTNGEIFGAPNIAIRGVSSPVGAATTAIYIDDAPIQVRTLDIVSGGVSLPQLFDLSRVEVLRGPQGTLFGSSAEGGAIRFITPTPRTDKTDGEIRFGLDFTQSGQPSYLTGAALGGPISDDLGFRVSALEQHDGGYINHVNRDTGIQTGRDTNSTNLGLIRAALTFKPVDGLTIVPSIYYQDSANNDRVSYYKDAGTFNTYNHMAQPIHDRFELDSISVDYDFDQVSLKSVTTSYQRTLHRLDDYSYVLTPAFTNGAEELPGLPNYLALSHQTTTQRNITEELRLSSLDNPQSRLNWTLGAFLSRAVQQDLQYIAQDIDAFAQALYGEDALAAFGQAGIGPGGAYSYTDYEHMVDRAIAVFGEANYKVTQATTATLGLRIAGTRFDYQSIQNGPLNGGLYSFTGSQQGTSVLPKLSVSTDLDKQNMSYFTMAKGDRVGGANASYGSVPGCAADFAALGISDNPKTYNPDSLWSYELGYKGNLMDGRLELATSVFLIDWKNIQEPILLPTCQFTFTENLARARSTGLELQSQYRYSSNLLLSGTFAYTDAKFTQDAYASANQGELLVKNGQSMPSPPITATAGAEYRWNPSVGGGAYTRADISFASGYDAVGPQGTYNYDPGVRRIPANHYVTLAAGYKTGSWAFSSLLDNALNARTDIFLIRYTPTDPNIQAATFRPRTVKFTAEYKF